MGPVTQTAAKISVAHGDFNTILNRIGISDDWNGHTLHLTSSQNHFTTSGVTSIYWLHRRGDGGHRCAGKVKNGNMPEAPKPGREEHATRFKNKIFIPALLIPIITVVSSLTYGKMHFGNVSFVDNSNVSLIALDIGTIVAYIIAQAMTKAQPSAPLHEGSRWMQAVRSAMILPQMLRPVRCH
jgi:Protein of unknown function (DUF979)